MKKFMDKIFLIVIYICYCKMTTAIIMRKSNTNENLRKKNLTLEEINLEMQLPEFENNIFYSIFDIIDSIDFKDINSINNVYLKEWSHLNSLDFMIYDFVKEIIKKVFIKLFQIQKEQENNFLNRVIVILDMFLADKKHSYEDELYYVAFETCLYGYFKSFDILKNFWNDKSIKNGQYSHFNILRKIIIKNLLGRKGCNTSKKMEILFGTAISKHLKSMADIFDSKKELKKYEEEKNIAIKNALKTIDKAFTDAEEFIKKNRYARKYDFCILKVNKTLKRLKSCVNAFCNSHIYIFFEDKISKSKSNQELIEKIFHEKPTIKKLPFTSNIKPKEYKKNKIATAWIFKKKIKLSEIFTMCVKEINLLYAKIEMNHNFHKLISEKDSRIEVFLSVKNILCSKKEHLEAIKTIFFVNFYKCFYINVCEKNEINLNKYLFMGKNQNYIYKYREHSTRIKIFTDLSLLEEKIFNKNENFVKIVFIIESSMNLNKECIINKQKSVQDEFRIEIKESVKGIYNFVEKIVTMFEFEQIEVQFLIRYISISNILDLNELDDEHAEDLLIFDRKYLETLLFLNNIMTEEVINLYKKVSQFSFILTEIKTHNIFDILTFKKNLQQERKRYEEGLSTINLDPNDNFESKTDLYTPKEVNEDFDPEGGLNIYNQKSGIKNNKTLSKEVEESIDSCKNIKKKKIKTKSSLPEGLVAFESRKKQNKLNLPIAEKENIIDSTKNRKKNNKQKKENYNISETIKQEKNRILYTKIVKQHIIDDKLSTYEFKNQHVKANIKIKKELKRLKSYETKEKDITNFIVLNIVRKTKSKSYNIYSGGFTENTMLNKTKITGKIEDKNFMDLISNGTKEEEIIPNINDYNEFPNFVVKKNEKKTKKLYKMISFCQKKII